MMMNFIDLSAASEEERRLIREILSDTSIVNIATPPQLRSINSTVSSVTALAAPTPAPTTSTTTSKHLSVSSDGTVPPPPTTTITTSSSYSTVTTTTKLATQQQQLHHHPPPPHDQQQQIYQHNIANKSAKQQQHNLSSTPPSNQVETSQQKIINLSTSAGAVVTTTTNSNTTTTTTITPARNQQDNFNKLAIKSQQLLALSTSPNTPANAHHHPQQLSKSVNGLDVNIDSGVVDTNKNVQHQYQQKGFIITSETNAPATTNVHNGQHQQQPYQPINNSQSRQQHINGPRQSFKNSSNQHINFSNNGHSGNSNNNLMGPNTVSSSNHRNSFSNLRKNIHNNSGKNSNSINGSNNTNNNNNNRSTRLSNSNNPVGGMNSVQQHYPQQYTSPLPSNTSPPTQYHNINVNNINNHSANVLAGQLNQQQQQRTTNDHSNDRLRSGGMSNHNNSNNDINIVVTSSSGLAALPPNLDQHHGSTMPLSVYNHPNTHMLHQVPPVMPTAKLDPKNNNLKNQTYHPQDTSNSNIQNTTSGAQTVPPSQMPQLAGDMNSVIGMDMTSTQPPGYAIPPHVAAFGPPAHHVYGGAPIFQPYHYLIPYNIPICPYVLPTNSVVPPRQQVPPQSNQSPNSSNTANAQPRHLNQQHQSHEQYHNLNNSNNQNSLNQTMKDEKTPNKDLNLLRQNQNLERNSSEKEVPEGSKQVSPAATTKTTLNNVNLQNDYQPSHPQQQKPDKHKKFQQESDLSLDNENVQSDTKTNYPEQVSGNIDKSNRSISNVNSISVSRNNNSSSVTNHKSVVPSVRGDKSESQQQQKHEVDSQQTNYNNSVKSQHELKNINSEVSRDNNERYQDAPKSTIIGKSTVEDSVKISSDEGFETQSSLDVSKQSHDTSTPISEQSKLFTKDNSNKSLLERKAHDLSELNNVKSNEVPQKAAGVWGAASSKSWADLFKRESCALLGSSVNGEIEHNISGSENSDEEIRTQRSISLKVDSSSKAKSRESSSKEQRSKEAAKRALDNMAPKLAQKITSLNLKHALPFLKPRGFINKGNGCYINATLQALIACPPFYNLMKEIGDLRGYRRENSCTPILDCFAEFFLNFPPLDSGKKNKQSSTQDQKMHINYLQAEAIEPKCIYNALGQIKSECLKGKFKNPKLKPAEEKVINLLSDHPN